MCSPDRRHTSHQITRYNSRAHGPRAPGPADLCPLFTVSSGCPRARPLIQADRGNRASCASSWGAWAITVAVAAPRRVTRFAVNAWSSCCSAHLQATAPHVHQTTPEGNPRRRPHAGHDQGAGHPEHASPPRPHWQRGQPRCRLGGDAGGSDATASPSPLLTGALAGTGRRRPHRVHPTPRALQQGAAGQPTRPRQAAEHLRPDHHECRELHVIGPQM